MNPNDPAVIVFAAAALGLAVVGLVNSDWLRTRQAASAAAGFTAMVVWAAGGGGALVVLWVMLAFCLTDLPREPGAPWMLTPGRGASLPGPEPAQWSEDPGDGGDRQA
jgi:hypothetical protein